MYRTTEKIQKRKDEKRQAFLDAAAKVFALKGYNDTTVKDIVREAEASVGSFYFYFDSKEKLFIELHKSIVNEFNATATRVVDVENFTMLKNFVRVMTATIRMYDRKRDIARIMLSDATESVPALQKAEAERMNESSQIMTGWFRRFKQHHEVNIPDERVAALMYEGSYYYFIKAWLSSPDNISLTEYGYSFCVYNLQALRIQFEEAEIREIIKEVLEELSIPGPEA